MRNVQKFTVLTALMVTGLTGCDTDKDEDGLLKSEEVELGTDPNIADTDGDSINDGDEVALGTDPLSADTDEDGVQDGEEVSLGIDPATQILMVMVPMTVMNSLRNPIRTTNGAGRRAKPDGQTIPRVHQRERATISATSCRTFPAPISSGTR